MEVNMYVPYAEIENEAYQEYIPISLQLAESKYPYLYWTERHLQAMWWEQKYFKNLKTKDDLSIEVISPGIWNGEAGPDFLKAHLKIGNQEIKGDIEIHLNDEHWFQHRHYQDSRYDHVILHISLNPSKVPKTIVDSKGRQIPQAYFEKSLTIPQSRILQLIDLEEYPYRKFLGSGRCAKTLFNSLTEEKIQDVFYTAADLRLTQKAIYLKSHIEDPRLLLPAGIAIALGYKNNSEAFFELFLRLLKHKDKTEKEMLAIALGICGFFSDKFRIKWQSSEFYVELYNKYAELSILAPHSIPLTLDKVRPLNHPIRRIVYLVKLLQDPLVSSLYAEIYLCWNQHWPSTYLKKNWTHVSQMFHERLPIYIDHYWNQHYTFENDIQTQPLPLLGKELKDVILVNTILPLLYVDIMQTNNTSEIKAFRNFYETLPAIHNSKADYLSNRFFGDLPKKKILQKAISQQGAFQLYKDFCMYFEASCDGCSFVDKYKKIAQENKHRLI